jgi:beta-galactosidase
MKEILLVTVALLIYSGTMSQVCTMADLNRHLSNPALVGEGQEPAHVPLVVFDNLNDALTGDWSRSPFYQSLDGEWKFRWDKTPLEAPDDFFNYNLMQQIGTILTYLVHGRCKVTDMHFTATSR